MTTDDQTYAFKNALDAQRERLRTLESLFDAGSIRCLEARGVRPGWRCAEVGAGGGSIATWLCDRVGPGGSRTCNRPRCDRPERARAPKP